MPRPKEPCIPDAVIDQFLAQADPKPDSTPTDSSMT
jgi:hypothetical protein